MQKPIYVYTLRYVGIHKYILLFINLFIRFLLAMSILVNYLGESGLTEPCLPLSICLLPGGPVPKAWEFLAPFCKLGKRSVAA